MQNKYRESKGKQSEKTKARQAERNRNVMFYNSSQELMDNPMTGKVSRKPYVNHEKRAERQAELKANKRK